MNIGIIGLGRMGGMLARAFLQFGAVQPEELWVANRSPERIAELRKQWSAARSGTNDEVARKADVLFVCVHAPDMQPVIEALRPSLRAGKTLVMISNQVPLATAAKLVPCAVAKVIPTVTQEAGRGTALLMLPPDSEPIRRQLETLLGKIGEVVVIPEELGRAAANLTSAGPALLAYVLEQMAAAAVAADPALDAERAWKLVVATAQGTGELLQTISAQELIDRVATPGGITEAALEKLRVTAPAMWRETFERMRQREAEVKARLERRG